MGRPKKHPAKAYSRVAHVRLSAEEAAGLKALSRTLKLPPSRIHRRLIREAINGGPDYFDDGAQEQRLLHIHLAAVGRNLNQLVRAANRGAPLLPADVQRVVDVLRLQLAGIEAHYLQAVGAAAWRAWRPLYQAAGLSSPFDQAGAAGGRPARAGRDPGGAPTE